MTKEDIMMEILRKLNMEISRSAVIVMLEDGICTQERPFEEYYIAKNIYNALNETDTNRAKMVLCECLQPPLKDRVLDVWNEYFKN